MTEPLSPPPLPTEPLLLAVRDLALPYPEAYEDYPWGERVYKVRGKIFVFAGLGRDGIPGLSVKLPESRHAALAFPGASPTGYGLGKSGWVSLRFPDESWRAEGLLAAWIDESYRAVAPKTLVKRLGT